MANSVDKLPILGNIELPIRIMHYNDKEDKKKFFQSGFAFFAVADDQADVSDNDGNDLGSLGGCMGGHYQFHFRKDGKSIDLIINVEDLWNLVINGLLESDEAKEKIEGIEEIYNEYWKGYQERKSEKDKAKARLEEVKKMQKEAEEEAEFERMLAEEKASRQPASQPEPQEGDFGSYKVLDCKGYDLSKELPDNSCDYPEDFIFEPDRGVGVKIQDRDGKILTAIPGGNTVTLDINTWRGTSFGAIHYYGTLRIDTPSFEMEGEEGWLRSVFEIPFFHNKTIELHHILEQWEIDRYPDNYKDCRPGYRSRGFYTQEEVLQAAQDFFQKHFDIMKWQLKVDGFEKTDNELDYE